MLDSSYLPLMTSLKNIDNFYTILRSVKALPAGASDVKAKRTLQKTIVQLRAELEFCNLCICEIDDD